MPVVDGHVKLAVEKAIYEAAPDVDAIEVADPVDATPSGPPSIAGTRCAAGGRVGASARPPGRSRRHQASG